MRAEAKKSAKGKPAVDQELSRTASDSAKGGNAMVIKKTRTICVSMVVKQG